MINLCVAITNYDFSEKADSLKDKFKDKTHTIIIDSSSPTPPKLTDISIPNTYYPGLWNASVNYVITNKFDWLMFIASDVDVLDDSLYDRCISILNTHPHIGIYTPSLTNSSRLSPRACFNKKGGKVIRRVPYIEGFFFVARTIILEKLYPIVDNKFGWGIDQIMARVATNLGYHIVVDDSVQIHHPAMLAQHAIDMDLADKDAARFFKKWRR